MMHIRSRSAVRTALLLVSMLTLIPYLPAQTFTSSNLPIVIVNTNGQTIVNEPKITAAMRIIYNGEGKRNAMTDTASYFTGPIGIEIRGSSSQMFPKKQYGFETRDASGEDLAVAFFDMPAESDWILSAQYNDKSLMRDALTYHLANATGRYASRSRYCELVINGEYRGVYMLFEKVKRDKNRVNISKLDATGTTGDALTGGYIIKIDKLDGSGNDGWYSSYRPYSGSAFKVLYQYHYPKPEDITPEQKTYIRNAVLIFETAFSSPYYQDTVAGYSKYLDVPSMVDFFLINELTRNVDGYRLSSYLYKDKDSKNPKFFLGPVWDFNHGFGNCDYYEASKIEGWQLEFQATNAAFRTTDEFQPPFWWKRVFDDPRFRDAAAARWTALRKGVFATPRINRFIDSIATHISEAQQRNFTKWPILNSYVWPNAFIGGTYANEVAYLKTWILFRLDWMDTQLAGRTLSVPQPGTMPLQPALFQNYPNPFNPSTTIRFSIPVSARTRITVHDLLGRSVRTVTDEEWSAGDHELRFDASGLSSGLYYYRITSGPFTQTRPMLLMK